jgi:hypothetical protein
LLLGILGMGWLSGRTADPSRRGPVSIWLGILSVVAIILITAASAVMGETLRDASAERGRMWSTIIGLGTFVSTLWISSIAVQVAQNFSYRRVGAPLQPIRWYAGQRKRRGRPKAGKRIS